MDYGKRRVAIAGSRLQDALVLPRSTPASAALFLCSNFVRNAVADNGIDHVFIESPVLAGARNVQTTVSLAMMAGAISYCCESLEVKVSLIAPSTWKKLVVGKGNATKDEVTDWLSAVAPNRLRSCYRNGKIDQDIVDAVCIGYAGHLELQGSESGDEQGRDPSSHEG